MSVVNKMLQDLETRQSQSNEINADYQAPPKKQSKLLVVMLLILAIAAIIFALTDIDRLLGETKSNKVASPSKSQSESPETTQKMLLATEKELQSPLQSQKQVNLQTNDKILTANSETPIEQLNNILEAEQIPPQQSNVTHSQQQSKASSVAENKSLEPPISTEVKTQESVAKPTSFSMASSSQENNRSSLKHRISESLNADNIELASSLLFQLLENEPENIKARKKLASLLFAQGNYAQSRQLLLQGMELHPTQADLRLMLARLYVVQEQPSQAMTVLSEFQPSTGNQVEYLGYRAALAQQLKQTKLAQSDYQILTNVESANAKWWLGLGLADDQLGNLNTAIRAYKRALSLDQLESSVNDFMQHRISVLTGSQ